MRRVPVVLTLAFLVGMAAAPARAQEVRLGAFGGAGLTSLAFSPAPPVDFSKPLRPNLGALVGFDVTEMMGFEARVAWQRKAVRWRESDGGVTATATALVDYVSAPLLLRVASPRGAARPYALVGTEISFKTRASLTGTVSGAGVGPSEVSEPDISDQLRSIDVALAVGGGLEFPAGRVSVFLDGLYTHGLRDLPADSVDSEYLSAKARTFRVNAGIRF